MSAPRLLTHDEVSALPEVAESWHAEDDAHGSYVITDDGYGITTVDGQSTSAKIDALHAVLMAASPNLRATALDLFAQLATAHARIADLERLAAGPRSAEPVDDDHDLARCIQIARISLAFGRVERATRHEDGVRVETDTDHTVMLGLLACEIAPPGLDRTKIAAYALVHDLAEVYAGDTQTLTISADGMAAKLAREDAARSRLVGELGDGSWLADVLTTYERQQEPEARFVRLIDKVLPKLTHALNGCAAALPLVDQRGFTAAHERQFGQIAKEYPEFPATLELLRSSMTHAESCWPSTVDDGLARPFAPETLPAGEVK